MKLPLVLLGCLSLLAGGCVKSPRQQAETAVQQYLRTNLNDPDSYEPGAFVVTPYTRADSAQAVHSQRWQQMLDNDSTVLVALTAAGRENEAASLQAKNSELLVEIKALSGIHDTARVGWRVEHDYRARNTANALVKQSAAFAVYLPNKVVPVK